MAKLVGYVNVRVDQAGADEGGSGNTCFGLPGNNGLRASMSSCHFNVLVAVYDDYRVYVGLNGYVVDDVVSNVYEVAMYVSSSDFYFSWQGGFLVATGINTKGSWSANIVTSGRSFRWNFSASAPPGETAGAPSGYVYVGQLTDFQANAQGRDGVLWLGGTGTYVVNDPLYPDPVRITVPGFMEFLDYFPFAIRKSGVMQSANREGGSTRIRKNGSWRDVKNVAVGSGNDDAFVRKSGAWEKAPKIGANAR